MMRESSALRPLFDAWRLLRLGLRPIAACGFIATLFVLVPHDKRPELEDVFERWRRRV